MLTSSKSIFLVACVGIVISIGAACANDGDPLDWPGAGKAQDWYAANALDDQANKVAEDILQTGTDKPDRVLAEKAIVLFKKAIAKYPYETAFYDNLARCYNDLGDEKQAEANYRKSVEVKEKYRGPQNKIRYADTYLLLARLCAKNKEPKDAEINFKKGLRQLQNTGDFQRVCCIFERAEASC
ncbi:hypothetical protein BH10CYA1_BH10CYA1_62110 [soil metagenome]